MFIRFDKIHERDGQTDGRTPSDGIIRAVQSIARQKYAQITTGQRPDYTGDCASCRRLDARFRQFIDQFTSLSARHTHRPYITKPPACKI